MSIDASETANPLDLRSDNVAAVAPEILEALRKANIGTALGYGQDPWTDRLRTRLSEVFERQLEVFPVCSGTAANALALAASVKPWGAVYCHETAHVLNTECAATEFFSGGAKLIGLGGDNFKLTPANLEAALNGAGIGQTFKVQPCALSLTQATDMGTVYGPQEISALTEVARRYRLRVHMDGARLANAIASLGARPADATWRAGVDILSFGATKNGAMNADAIVVFDREIAEELGFRLRRAGHVPSKMRFLSAQILAYLDDDLWLRNAARANAVARAIAVKLGGLPGVRLVAPVEANLVFVQIPEEVATRLIQAGLLYYPHPNGVIRLVTNFGSTEADAERCAAMFASANNR